MLLHLDEAASPESEARASDISRSVPSGPRSDRLVWVGLAGLLLLVAGCSALQEQQLPFWAAAALAAGLGAWLYVSRGCSRERPEPDLFEDTRVDRPKIAIGVPLSLGLAAVSWWQASVGVFHPLGVASWFLALVVWLWAWWPRPRGFVPSPGARPRKPDLGIAGALLLILAIGVFFRFHRLAEIPPHPGSDHAEDLMNVVELEEGERPVFFPRNTGQAPLPFYWEFLLHRAFGLPLTHLGLKISTAAVGMLAIPAVYVLGSELGGTPLGLIAAALCAWCKWPVFGARRGLSFAWAVFPAALAMAAILRYLRRADRRSALAAGLWLGLGQFGYNAFKVVPLMVPAAFSLALLDRRWRGRRRRLIGDGLLVAATTTLVCLPLLQYMLKHPEDFWYRTLTRVGSRERPLPGPALGVFLGNVKNMLLAFHWKGDHAWINSVFEEPFLDPVTGALLFAGVVLALAGVLRGSRSWAAVLVSVLVLTLASTLSLAFPIENPGINRAAVALPSILVLAALPAAALLRQARGATRGARLAATGVLVLLAAVSIRLNYDSYFRRFEAQQAMMLEPVMDVVEVMNAYRTRGVPFEHMYLLNTSDWMDGRCIGFEIGDPDWAQDHDIAPDEPLPPISERPLVFVVHPSDAEHRRQLREQFPGAGERLQPQRFSERNYITVFVPR